MSPIRTFVCFFVILISIASSLLLTGCVPPAKQPPHAPASVVGKEMYSMGYCDVEDRRAPRGTGFWCRSLLRNVKYGLFKVGLHERFKGKAPREIRMTITSYTVRTTLAGWADKCGINVKVEIVDRENGKIVHKSDISYYGPCLYEQEMFNNLSDKIVEFLISAASK